MTAVRRRALVTGGASGIGAACARRLARDDLHVVVADLDGDGAEKVARDVGGEAWQVDLADTAALSDLSLDVDVLVNNAGIQHVAPVHEFPPERFAAILALMVEAPFLLVRAALPAMYARGAGRVVNISSVHGLVASPFKSAYVTAKHALEGLSKVVALEGGEHGVTSNCVNPGYVRTPLVERQVADQAAVHGIGGVRRARAGHARRHRDQAAGGAGRGGRPGGLGRRPVGVLRQRSLADHGRRLDRALTSRGRPSDEPRP